MSILLAIGVLLVFAAVFGPQWWVRHMLAKHAADRPDLPGTGAELARHLLDEAGLQSNRPTSATITIPMRSPCG